MGEWREYTLDDVCLKITDGAHQSPKSVDIGMSMVSVKDLTPFGLNIETARKISNVDYEMLVKQGCQPEVGDVLIAKDGNSALDTVCNIIEPVEVVLLSSVAILRPNTTLIDSRFLKYYFSSNRTIGYLKTNFISGAAIPRVVLRDFKKALIMLPDLETQESISDILQSLDDKIELNRKMNETLEEMARAIFKSWFVDFDPVHAKARGEKPAGMPDEIADLFPSEFVHSDQLNKPIPKGWEVKPISCLADLNSKSWTNKNAPKKIKYIDLANTKNGEISLVIEYLFPEAPSRARRVLSIGDTIIGTVRPGNRSFAYISDDGLTGSTGFAVMTPKQFDFKEFVFLALTQDSSIDYFAHLADGAAYPAVRPEVVANIEFVIPPENIVKAFSITTADLLVKIDLNRKQNIELSVIRDSLLPKLISGKIEV
ncbi:restriction endonuclease subunit S [Geovibrio thiophilus]|uniref:Restriction endonuclease subunit S n=1 Tax=Geovibrio thiophilus TaxID=139438 RepID=A0A3R5X470_9BACT|nr:restriction endonuclease subunit S [Geovibrio thiophilus]QAR34020.1 restriction endonuclease subunit S [Geovibrio thiophilus]